MVTYLTIKYFKVKKEDEYLLDFLIVYCIGLDLMLLLLTGLIIRNTIWN